MSKAAKPVGVVGVVISPDGHIVGESVDFRRDKFGGFDLFESQRHRVRDGLADAVIQQGCAHYIAQAIRGYDAQQLLNRLTSDHGFHVKYIAVGQKETP